ncbi:MAG TPA: hypothetical protein VIM99_00430 [Blastocatellia bacterium]
MRVELRDLQERIRRSAGRFQTALALRCVVAVEGCFAWLVYGGATSFSSGVERNVSVAGIAFLFSTMAVNIVTHYQMAKGIELNEFQLFSA